LRFIRYLDDFPVAEVSNSWHDTASGAFTEDKVYVVQTNTTVIERCLLMATDPGDLVLDPTAKFFNMKLLKVRKRLSPNAAVPQRYPYLITEGLADLMQNDELGRMCVVPTVQQALVDLQLLRDKPDGLLGPMTRNAIRDFQRSAGLPAAGEPGKEVYLALRQALAKREVEVNSPLPLPPKQEPTKDEPSGAPEPVK